MHHARWISERVAFRLLRLAATGTAAAGLALLVPVLALVVAGSGRGELARTITAAALRAALALLFAAGLSLYLCRARTTWLPDDRLAQTPPGRLFGSWLILLPLTLIAVPAWMVASLELLATFWRDVIALADQLDAWQGIQRSSGFATGYVLAPVIVVLTVPALEAVAAATCIAGAALLLILMFIRSARFARAYVIVMLLQGAMVLPGLIGTGVAEQLAPSVEQLIGAAPDPGSVEQARAEEEIRRYRTVTSSAGLTLAWAWAALALWTPILVLSNRARAAFASAGASWLPRPPSSVDLRAVDTRHRERAYMDAARQMEGRGPVAPPGLRAAAGVTILLALVAIYLVTQFLMQMAAR